MAGELILIVEDNALNRQLLEALFGDPANWCETTLSRGEALDAPVWSERRLARA